MLKFHSRERFYKGVDLVKALQGPLRSEALVD